MKTAEQKVTAYLNGRKTPATQAQIAKATGVNKNTLRRLIGEMWERKAVRVARHVTPLTYELI